MKRPLFLFVSLLLWSGALFSQQSLRYAVYFETDRHELDITAQQILDHVLKELQYPEDYAVEILAHTDSRGSDAYNLGLAERRAQSVTAYLATRGLKTEKTTTASLGEKDPAYTNDDETGRQGNRRVDLVVNMVTLQSLTELTDRLTDNHTQYFTINPGEPAQLTGAQGTRLWIAANAFEFEDGNGAPGAPVAIELKETYKMSDMILSDLTTTCGDQLLETAGMFYINASSNGKPLQLKEGAQIVTAMPAQKLQKGMQLFLGEQNAEGRLVNWQATGQNYQTTLEATMQLSPMPRLPKPQTRPLPTYVIDYSKQPQLYEKPRPPYKPIAPRRETVIYKPGFIDRMAMGREKVRQKEEAMFQKQMALHERQLKNYEEKYYPAYLAALAQYKADSLSLPARLKSWGKEEQQKKEAFYKSNDYLSADKKNKDAWAVQEAIWLKKMERWKEENKDKIKALKAQGRYLDNGMAAMDAYFYQVNRLGWVNCDVFSNTPGERMQLAIRDKDNTEERVYIILRDRNSVLSAGKGFRSDLYVTAGIPKTTPVTILAIKMEEGRPKMALRETHAGEEPEYQLDYKDCSLGDIRLALSRVNG